jgi:hypothetical protein
MATLRSIAARLWGWITAVDVAPFLRFCRRATVWLARGAWISWCWLLPRARRLARLLWRLLRRFALWIAAKPIRAADLLVALAVVLSLASLVPPRNGEQLAFLPVPLDYSNSLDCLSLNIYHEARGEPQDGQLAVAKVVMNRVSDPRFPNDVCGVVTDGGTREPGRCQFSWWCDGKSDKPRDAAAWRDSRSLAKDVLAGKFDDPTGGALWYHADYVQPNWRMDITKGPKIGRHIFYASAKR